MANNYNALDMSPSYEDIARGKVFGAEPFGCSGERVASGADSGLLWSNGAFVYPPSAGTQVSVSSTSANDIAVSGTGARTVDIHYLDNNLIDQVETVALNGTTAVATTATNIRFIQRVHVLTYGSGKAAAGAISFVNGANTYAQIPAGSMRSTSTLRMVPKGKRLLITSMFGGSTSGTAAAKSIIRISSPCYDEHDFTIDSIFIPLFSATFQDNSAGLTIPCPIVLTEGQSVGMTFETDKAATIVGSWFGWIENV